MEHLLAWVRITNIVLGLACFFLCVTKAATYWSRFSDVAKGFTMALTVFSFATLWGTGEQMATHVPPASRTVVTTVALVNLLYALWRTRGVSFYVQFTPQNRVR